jgi:hypothetical protein
VIASNAAQDVASFPVTSAILEVTIKEQEICIEHTKRGRWPEWYSDTAESLVEGSVWIFAYIDGVLHGATYESKRPLDGEGQLCKALTPEEYGGTVATRLAGHIKEGPLAEWEPQPGEEVGFLETTPARLGDEHRAPLQERSNLHWTVWPDFPHE